MSYLLIKEKDKNQSYKRAKQLDFDVYHPDIKDYVLYDPETKLDEGQWFLIEKFSEKDFKNELINNPWDSTFNQYSKIDVDLLDHIVSYQNNNEFCFQKIYKRAKIDNKSLIHFKEELKFETANNTIIISDEPDAVYLKNEDALYFKKITSISSIFDGIDILYREATQTEVDNFIGSEYISLMGDFSSNKVGKENRKRIAMIKDKMDSLDQESKDILFKYTDEYFPKLGFDGKCFNINNDNDLKNLLFGLSERCFTTPITGEKKAANSVVSI